MASATLHFPADFLWGATTADHLVGADDGSDWWAWANRPPGPLPRSEIDWKERAEISLRLAAKMGHNAHRLSLSWSRIEPEPGRFDHKTLDQMRDLLGKARELGLDPMITLHHFSSPLWLGDAFANENAIQHFGRFATTAAETFGDLVTRWITFNEPVAYLFNRYMHGVFPQPREKGWPGLRRAYRNILRSHGAAYAAIKAVNGQAQVGVAKHFRYLNGQGGFLARRRAKRLSALLNDAFLESLKSGEVGDPFGDESIPGLAGSLDFIGINYYAETIVGPRIGLGRLADAYLPLVPGEEGFASGRTSAEGIYQAVKRMLHLDKPIFITANGLPDAADDARSAYLLTHLREIWRAISFCFPVMGYFHDCLLTGPAPFEWRGDYGLATLSREGEVPQIRPSGRLFTEICRKFAIDDDMARRYAAPLDEVMFPGKTPDLNRA